MATAEELDRAIINNGAPNTTINLNDPQLTAIDNQTNNAIKESNLRYDTMRNNVTDTINGINNQLETGYNKVNEALQQKTDQTVKELEQQRDYAYKDYQKEQRGAYTDYKKATDVYGTNADILHRYGLDKTGYAESSMIAMYTTYQNRVATARESWNRTQDNFNNAIANAKITGNVEQAQNSLSLLQTQANNLMTSLGYQVSIMQNAINQENTLRNYGLQQKNFTYGVMSDNINRGLDTYNNAVSRQMTRDERAREQSNFDREMALNEAKFDYTKQSDKEKMDYQKQRDNIEDNQWQQTFDYNKTNTDRDYEQSQQKIDLSYFNAGISNPNSSSQTKISNYDIINADLDNIDWSAYTSDIDFLNDVKQALKDYGITGDEYQELWFKALSMINTRKR